MAGTQVNAPPLTLSLAGLAMRAQVAATASIAAAAIPLAASQPAAAKAARPHL